MAKFELPDDPVKVVDHETRKREGGLMSGLFGLSTEKPGNIASFVIIASIALLGLILIFGTDSQSISKKDEVTVVAGFITVALGFVFGSKS